MSWRKLSGPNRLGRIGCLPAAICLALVLTAGCMPRRLSPTTEMAARDEAVDVLKLGVGYEANPAIRAQAIEALHDELSWEGIDWIRQGLDDVHPGVCFAACVALGELRDSTSRAALSACLEDSDPSVRVGAMFALHRLGDTRHAKQLADWLLHHKNPEVRRNVALVLGRLEEPDAVKLLGQVLKDADESVGLQALESMALLGDRFAQQQLAFYCNSGTYKEAFALTAMGRVRNPVYVEALRDALKRRGYAESKLAAARSLGWLGCDDGLRIALKYLRFNSPNKGDVKDPPENQIMRKRSMAALALGAIGDRRALRPLYDALFDNDDPRIQIAVAKAILEVCNRAVREDPSFGQETKLTSKKWFSWE